MCMVTIGRTDPFVPERMELMNTERLPIVAAVRSGVNAVGTRNRSPGAGAEH
jgi:hypothetical protein